MAAKRPNKKKGLQKEKERERERERDVVLLPSTRSIRWIIRATGEANRWRKKGTYRPLFGLNWSWLHFFLVNRSGLVDFIRFWKFFYFIEFSHVFNQISLALNGLRAFISLPLLGSIGFYLTEFCRLFLQSSLGFEGFLLDFTDTFDSKTFGLKFVGLECFFSQGFYWVSFEFFLSF